MRKQKIDRCDVCGRRIRNENDALYQIIRPKGISSEVFQEAILQAEKHEENSPTPDGPERWAYRMLAMNAPVESEDDRVIAGRAFQALGFRLVQFHQACKDDAPESSEYVTEGWPEN